MIFYFQECTIIFDDAAPISRLPSSATTILPETEAAASAPLATIQSLTAALGITPAAAVVTETNGGHKDEAPSPIVHDLTPVTSSSPKEKVNTSSDDLAEAASKISLLNPTQFKPFPTLPDHLPDILQSDELSTEETGNDEPSAEDDGNESDDEGESDDKEGGEYEESEYEDASVPKLESLGGNDHREKDFISGNSSPSREVATILSTDEQRFEDVSSNDKTLQDSPSPEFSQSSIRYPANSTSVTSPSSHTIGIALNSSSGTIFPNPPALPTNPTSVPSSQVPHPGKLLTPHHHETSSAVLESKLTALQKEVASLREELVASNNRRDRTGSAEVNAHVEAVISTR